ncbi:MAG TPA: DISARM system phospholipase D-like protein DrmC [Nannocystaceae bacterium]|nr:DISARM system phospholipase D-like protein DrmC [Nannocystaceae bacterium]
MTRKSGTPDEPAPRPRSLAAVALTDLRALHRSVVRGRLSAPLRRVELAAEGFAALAEPLLSALSGLDRVGLLAALEVTLAERSARAAPLLDLVWTGPEARQSTARDTAVVLRELFAGARESVLIAGFRFDHGESLFEPLHQVMRDHSVAVRLFTDIDRRPRDPADPAECADSFAWRFFKRNWPWPAPRPEIWYDPRTAEPGKEHGASMHAKVVVVDRARTLIGSANFTQRAHTRNIEAGALIDDPHFATRLTEHFGALISDGFVRRARTGGT